MKALDSPPTNARMALHAPTAQSSITCGGCIDCLKRKEWNYIDDKAVVVVDYKNLTVMEGD